MSRRTKAEPPEAVSELLSQLTIWRKTRTGAREIPESFWSTATQLGREYGVSQVSRHLKLDFYKLKRRVLSKEDATDTKGCGFVELRWADVPGTPTHGGGFVTEMEMCRPGEVTVRVRQSGPSGIDMAGLIARCFGES